MRLTNLMRESFVRAVMADVPKKNFDDEIFKLAKEAVHYSMPNEILGIVSDNKLNIFLHKAWYSLPDGCPSFHYFRPDEGLSLSVKAPMYWEKLIALGKEKLAHNRTISELESKITACAAACSTRKQLADMLPEFQKYMPPDEAKAAQQYPLVANVVAEFVKAGWPKNNQLSK